MTCFVYENTLAKEVVGAQPKPTGFDSFIMCNRIDHGRLKGRRPQNQYSGPTSRLCVLTIAASFERQRTSKESSDVIHLFGLNIRPVTRASKRKICLNTFEGKTPEGLQLQFFTHVLVIPCAVRVDVSSPTRHEKRVSKLGAKLFHFPPFFEFIWSYRNIHRSDLATYDNFTAPSAAPK